MILFSRIWLAPHLHLLASFCSRPANSMGRISASLAPPDRDIQHHLAAESWAAPVLVSINRRRKPAKSIKTTVAAASLRRALSPDTLFRSQSRPWPAPWQPLFFRPAPPIISRVAASRQTPVQLQRSAKWASSARRLRRGEVRAASSTFATSARATSLRR